MINEHNEDPILHRIAIAPEERVNKVKEKIPSNDFNALREVTEEIVNKAQNLYGIASKSSTSFKILLEKDENFLSDSPDQLKLAYLELSEFMGDGSKKEELRKKYGPKFSLAVHLVTGDMMKIIESAVLKPVKWKEQLEEVREFRKEEAPNSNNLNNRGPSSVTNPRSILKHTDSTKESDDVSHVK